MEQSPGLPNNAGRVSLGRLARDSAFELILTTVLLFGVVSIVRWVIGLLATGSFRRVVNGACWIAGRLDELQPRRDDFW